MSAIEWLDKFASVVEWDGPEKPTRITADVYPHFYIDVLAAWERARQVGAREVLTELRRRIANISPVTVGHWWDEEYGRYPSGIEVIRVDDSGEMQYGYRRRWEEGLYRLPNGETATEITWHVHDGYGEEAGTVEVWAVFVPHKYAI